jgi:ferredoxin
MMARSGAAENQQYTIDLERVGRRVVVEAGTNLLEAAQRAGVDLVASCGGWASVALAACALPRER